MKSVYTDLIRETQEFIDDIQIRLDALQENLDKRKRQIGRKPIKPSPKDTPSRDGWI